VAVLAARGGRVRRDSKRADAAEAPAERNEPASEGESGARGAHAGVASADVGSLWGTEHVAAAPARRGALQSVCRL